MSIRLRKWNDVDDIKQDDYVFIDLFPVIGLKYAIEVQMSDMIAGIEEVRKRVFAPDDVLRATAKYTIDNLTKPMEEREISELVVAVSLTHESGGRINVIGKGSERRRHVFPYSDDRGD